jgi:hypothetical protein
MSVNDITADDIATMRARLLLVGEQPQLRERSAESLVGGFVRSVGQDRIVGSIFPNIWVETAGDLTKPRRFIKSGCKKAQKQIFNGWIGIEG